MRSITLQRLLNKRDVEALACGVDKDYSPATIQHFFGWPEVIFIQRESLAKFRKRFALEIEDGSAWTAQALVRMNTCYDVGFDDWKVPQADSLMMMMREMVDATLERYGSVIDPHGWVVERA